MCFTTCLLRENWSFELLFSIYSPNKEKKIIFADERGKNIADVSIVIPFIYFDLLNILMSIALFFPLRIYIATNSTTQRPDITTQNYKKDVVPSVS